jgi:hypothetical protein
MKSYLRVLLMLVIGILMVSAAEPPDGKHQVSPEELVKELSEKAPVILNVGPRTLYDQVHIRGAE